MARNQPNEPAPLKAKTARQPGPQPGPWPFPFRLRLCLSAWLVWHVAVVFLAPLSLQPKSSELALQTAQSPFIRWYTDPLYLNGGYSFFSPDPPLGGRVVRYKVYGEGREPVVEGEFPNHANPSYAKQWPRLWYHRHMMLVDQAADLRVFEPANGTPAALESAEQENLRLTMRSYARHLLRTHNGRAVELELISHRSLHPEEAAAGVSPTDAPLYRSIMAVTELAEQLDQPLLPEPLRSGGVETLPPGEMQ